MVSNYLIFSVSYFLIIFSVIGHGLLAINLYKLKISTHELGFVGLIGIFFLIIYSYLSHFFVNHGYFHNFILLMVGFISFIYFKSQILNKNNLVYVFTIFSILFLSFIIFKTHDDFRYYHFPYSFYLNEFQMIVGVGSLNHGFKTPSSIFYLNSLFFLPHIKYYLYHIGAILIMGFSNIVLISNIKEFLKKKETHFIFLNLLAFIFTNIFFYRIAEHGTDRSAQILVFVFFIYILSFRDNYKNFEIRLSKIIILLALIISLKSFYIVYLIFFLPFIYYIMLDKKINLLKKILNNQLFYFSILLGTCVILVYFFNTGCLLYPLEQTCLSIAEWGIPKSEVKALNIHYQWWSKAGGGPGYRSIIEPYLYIQNFSWVKDWISLYFFNKVSDYLLSLLFILIIFLFVFKSKKKRLNFKGFKKNVFYYYFIFFLFLEWFFYHPSLRYGGYVIISLIFFIPLSYFLTNNETTKNFKFKIMIIVLLVTSIFIGRNIDRVIYEINFYKANFKKNMFYFIDKEHFRIDDQLKKFSKNYYNCNLNNQDCIDDKDFLIKKNMGN